MFRASLALAALLLLIIVALLQAAAFGQTNRDRFDDPLAPRADRRREIKAMDILERPHRAGHVYGNTVRRRFERTLQAGDDADGARR
jgi:hypothetical protein